MKLPKYINCHNEEVEHCEYYMTKECHDTCAYAMSIGSDVVRDQKSFEGLEREAMFMEVDQ